MMPEFSAVVCEGCRGQRVQGFYERRIGLQATMRGGHAESRAAAIVILSCFAHLAAAQPSGGSPGGPVYQCSHDPYSDARFHFAERCVEFVSNRIFGWYDTSLSYDLRLDAPMDPNLGTATGANATGQAFTIYTHMLVYPAHTNVPAGCTIGHWSGSIAGPLGSYPCSGFLIEGPEETKIIPFVALVDEALGWDVHWTMLDNSLRATCAMDALARGQLEQNIINANACQDTRAAQYGGVVLGCGVGMLITCGPTAGIGCIAGLGCMGVALIGAMVHDVSYFNEWDRSLACLCAESAWRAENPGQTLPTTCGTFTCPPFQLFGF